MTDDDTRSLLAPYALDAVDDVERRAVERLVEEDAEAARELASFRETVAELATATAVEPPAAMRAALLAEIGRTPQAGPAPARTGRAADVRTRNRGSAGTATVLRPRFGRLGLVAAAAAVVLVAVPGVALLQTTQRAGVAEARAELLADALADPDAQLVRSEVVGGGDAVAVLGSEGAVLVAQDLPELADDAVYQLWSLGADGVPTPAGFVEAGEGGAVVVADGYEAGEALAMTVEPAGGSEQPTTEVLVVLAAG